MPEKPEGYPLQCNIWIDLPKILQSQNIEQDEASYERKKHKMKNEEDGLVFKQNSAVLRKYLVFGNVRIY
jgi:hypothetical protein